MLAELTDWLGKKSPDMATPPNSEPKPAATARAVLYMSLYLYNGPETPPPTYSPNADAVTGLVTPGAPATIVTPTKHAGVQFEAGSVDETTIIVITQNLTPYPANCTGPLQTKLCQYPQFYTFEQFPHKTLLKPAKFNACHINAGASRRPLADHDRFRLAHSKPADPADYTPGSVIRDQNGESIEILPLVPQTFSTCEDNEYSAEIIGSTSTSLGSRLARAVKKLVTPRTAYAIDLGLGGLSRSFSQFNDVDPLGEPDLSIESMTVGQPVNHPGDQMSLSVVVSNFGTATKSAGQGIVYLTPPAPVVIEGPPQQPADVQVATIAFPAIAPGSVDTVNNVQFSLPSNIASGSYQVKMIVGSDPVLGDLNAANDTAIRSINVDGGIINLGTLPGDDGSIGYAINDAGHAVGGSSNALGSRPFLWINGNMTSLGTLGGSRGYAQGINNNDEVVGYSELANGESRAFLWKNGTMTNLGTLPGTNASEAVGINSSGQIAGYSYNTTTGGSVPSRAWIWQNGVMTAIDIPTGYSRAVAFAINDHGQVVGAAYGDQTAAAWIWQNGLLSVINSLGRQAEAIGIGDDGTVVGDFGDEFSSAEWQAFVATDGFTPLPTLAGDEGGEGHAISSDGTIVGLSYGQVTGGYEFHAVMWRNGQPVNLGTLGGTTGWPLGINDLDQVIGFSTIADNKNRATIWNVAPPPVIR
jgi:probable HAF family extracellular repeat protein